MSRRKRSNARNPNFQAWPVQAQVALGTLADNTVLASTLLGVAQNARILHADLAWTLRNAAAGEVPIQVGLSHSDLSVAEVLEALNAQPSSQGAIIEREQASRPVRKVGSFGRSTVTDQSLKDGEEIRTQIGWDLGPSFDLDVYAVNRSGGALTTGAYVVVTGTVYGIWK